MIARPLPYEDLISRSGTRSGRTAALVRRKRTRQRSYAGVLRIVATATAFTLAIVVYLALMANVTRMNYELARTLREKTQVRDESSRLDDRIARLASRERLERLAARLGMHEAQSFAQVALPAAHAAPAPAGVAFLPWLK